MVLAFKAGARRSEALAGFPGVPPGIFELMGRNVGGGTKELEPADAMQTSKVRPEPVKLNTLTLSFQSTHMGSDAIANGGGPASVFSEHSL